MLKHKIIYERFRVLFVRPYGPHNKRKTIYILIYIRYSKLANQIFACQPRASMNSLGTEDDNNLRLVKLVFIKQNTTLFVKVIWGELFGATCL